MDTEYISEQILMAQANLARAQGELDKDPPAHPIVDPPPLAGNYLIVGKGHGAPGEEVTIEILGQTQEVPVNGWGMYFGCSPELELVSGAPSNEIKNLINLTNPMHLFTQGRGGTTQTAFIAAFTAFFQTITVVDDPRGRQIVSVVLPPLTPLAQVVFKIPASATSKHRYHLDNRSWYYGREFKDGQGNTTHLKTTNLFTTDRKVAKHGLDPKLVSGWIDVD